MEDFWKREQMNECWCGKIFCGPPEINLNCVYINVFTFKEYYFLYGFF